ncbi:ATP-dependent nuclease [Nocardia alni]|uniref:ATP-dependent nuclease n=1 Tax=Nocardia alni TaxID=2815723 RepID=UPI001C220050|nr:AAA family ATPase [Nocardia alni]
MFIESVTLDNFQCFGPGRTTVQFDDGLTAFVGPNGSGKTATCQALLRLFGITAQERTVRVDDFHVSVSEVAAPTTRQLTVEVVLAFPELDTEEPDNDDDQSTSSALTVASRAVPEFFQRMAATDESDLKVRIVLDAEWVDDGTVDGAITDTRRVVSTFAEKYGEDSWVPLTPAERSRIQMVYIPASRDGARQVTTFLRSRLWRAAQWSTELRDLVSGSASEVAGKFMKEPVVEAVETALTNRWKELHDAGTSASPRLRLLDGELNQLVRNSELVFEPDPTGSPRPARLLSDGQRSLLYLALTAATLDVEAAVVNGDHDDEFTLEPARLPNLTLIAVEEPENSLSPFFLSRIVNQLQDLSDEGATQVILSSHSASVFTRIRPEVVRHFRLSSDSATAAVHEIILPTDDTEAGKFLREAVHAYPELYFAKFVVLGEGDSEQIVIPRVATALGVSLDSSFVAVVPLGGRHTNHMWKLLNDLKIPHATLLDLDYGRDGAGPARLRDACNRLIANGIDPLADLEGYDDIAAIGDELELDALQQILMHLRKFGIFFGAPLDLDYLMLRRYPDAYTKLEADEIGPHQSDATDVVIGKSPTQPAYWSHPKRAERLRWYRYLFTNRSKPSSHLRALGRLTDDELQKSAPEVVVALVNHIRREVGI